MSPIDWPETNNYFSFYGLEPVFEIDTVALKQLFLTKSKAFHPDFFGDDMSAQSRAIEITAYNNKAYRILSQPIERIRYLINMNASDEIDDAKLPQDFLMEMLELNEEIDAFEFAENKADHKNKIESEINAGRQDLLKLLSDLVVAKNWEKAKSELLKLNYLERLLGRLQNMND